MCIATGTIASGLPDGVNAPEGVLAFARLAGYDGDHLPGVVIFGEEYFSETTAFIRTSSGDGYYRTTLTTCTCPSFKFQGGSCKHQQLLAERLKRKARIDERNRRRAEERARPPTPSTRRGFNLPQDDDFPVKLAVAPL
jgi:hypothetical protein